MNIGDAMKKIKISLILNIIIVLLVLIGSIFMFTGFKFMSSSNLILQTTKLGMFKYYTVDSNILIGIVSLILLIYEYKLINKKIDKIPKTIYILKFIGTAGITLTFLTTLLFLAPQYGFFAMYNNTNLLFHFMVPVLSIISYIMFEKYENSYKYSFLGIVPMFIYSIIYTVNIIIHLEEGTMKYDIYGFLKGDINNAYIVLPSIYLVSILISIVLIFLNRRKNESINN